MSHYYYSTPIYPLGDTTPLVLYSDFQFKESPQNNPPPSSSTLPPAQFILESLKLWSPYGLWTSSLSTTINLNQKEWEFFTGNVILQSPQISTQITSQISPHSSSSFFSLHLVPITVLYQSPESDLYKHYPDEYPRSMLDNRKMRNMVENEIKDVREEFLQNNDQNNDQNDPKKDEKVNKKEKLKHRSILLTTSTFLFHLPTLISSTPSHGLVLACTDMSSNPPSFLLVPLLFQKKTTFFLKQFLHQKQFIHLQSTIKPLLTQPSLTQQHIKQSGEHVNREYNHIVDIFDQINKKSNFDGSLDGFLSSKLFNPLDISHEYSSKLDDLFRPEVLFRVDEGINAESTITQISKKKLPKNFKSSPNNIKTPIKPSKNGANSMIVDSDSESDIIGDENESSDGGSDDDDGLFGQGDLFFDEIDQDMDHSPPINTEIDNLHNDGVYNGLGSVQERLNSMPEFLNDDIETHSNFVQHFSNVSKDVVSNPTQKLHSFETHQAQKLLPSSSFSNFLPPHSPHSSHPTSSTRLSHYLTILPQLRYYPVENILPFYDPNNAPAVPPSLQPLLQSPSSPNTPESSQISPKDGLSPSGGVRIDGEIGNGVLKASGESGQVYFSYKYPNLYDILSNVIQKLPNGLIQYDLDNEGQNNGSAGKTYSIRSAWSESIAMLTKYPSLSHNIPLYSNYNNFLAQINNIKEDEKKKLEKKNEKEKNEISQIDQFYKNCHEKFTYYQSLFHTRRQTFSTMLQKYQQDNKHYMNLTKLEKSRVKIPPKKPDQNSFHFEQLELSTTILYLKTLLKNIKNLTTLTTLLELRFPSQSVHVVIQTIITEILLHLNSGAASGFKIYTTLKENSYIDSILFPLQSRLDEYQYNRLLNSKSIPSPTMRLSGTVGRSGRMGTGSGGKKYDLKMNFLVNYEHGLLYDIYGLDPRDIPSLNRSDDVDMELYSTPKKRPDSRYHFLPRSSVKTTPRDGESSKNSIAVGHSLGGNLGFVPSFEQVLGELGYSNQNFGNSNVTTTTHPDIPLIHDFVTTFDGLSAIYCAQVEMFGAESGRKSNEKNETNNYPPLAPYISTILHIKNILTNTLPTLMLSKHFLPKSYYTQANSSHHDPQHFLTQNNYHSSFLNPYLSYRSSQHYLSMISFDSIFSLSRNLITSNITPQTELVLECLEKQFEKFQKFEFLGSDFENFENFSHFSNISNLSNFDENKHFSSFISSLSQNEREFLRNNTNINDGMTEFYKRYNIEDKFLKYHFAEMKKMYQKKDQNLTQNGPETPLEIVQRNQFLFNYFIQRYSDEIDTNSVIVDNNRLKTPPEMTTTSTTTTTATSTHDVLPLQKSSSNQFPPLPNSPSNPHNIDGTNQPKESNKIQKIPKKFQNLLELTGGDDGYDQLHQISVPQLSPLELTLSCVKEHNIVLENIIELLTVQNKRQDALLASLIMMFCLPEEQLLEVLARYDK